MIEISNVSDVQGVLFDTLCYFDEFCRSHNIRYYISNGTLIGAAKYQKFIPWDDDADVLIPREDYDRLMKLREINTDKYRLLCREQVKEWKIPYAKLSCNDTLVKEGDYNFGTENGVSIDIFPIDNWMPNICFAKIQAIRADFLKRMLICSIGGDFKTKKTGIKRVVLKFIWILGRSIGTDRILKKIDRMVSHSRKRKKKYAGCVCWSSHGSMEVFPCCVFESEVKLDFCGRSFPTMLGYEDYLDSLYGSWREELPPEKQHSNHEIKAWWKNAQ